MVRFTNNMLISPESTPQYDLFPRNDSYFIYLKPDNVYDATITKDIRFAGPPPLWIWMPPHLRNGIVAESSRYPKSHRGFLGETSALELKLKVCDGMVSFRAIMKELHHEALVRGCRTERRIVADPARSAYSHHSSARSNALAESVRLQQARESQAASAATSA